jgi:hypothetical protein
MTPRTNKHALPAALPLRWARYRQRYRQNPFRYRQRYRQNPFRYRQRYRYADSLLRLNPWPTGLPEILFSP